MQDREEFLVILKGLIACCKSKEDVLNSLRKYASDIQMDSLEREIDALYENKQLNR